jgi:hypothetical protein
MTSHSEKVSTTKRVVNGVVQEDKTVVQRIDTSRGLNETTVIDRVAGQSYVTHPCANSKSNCDRTLHKRRRKHH